LLLNTVASKASATVGLIKKRGMGDDRKERDVMHCNDKGTTVHWLNDLRQREAKQENAHKLAVQIFNPRASNLCQRVHTNNPTHFTLHCPLPPLQTFKTACMCYPTNGLVTCQ
jgi:hypothetical protein